MSKHKLDFEILDVKHPEYLIIADLSDYFEDPSHPVFFIKSPNSTFHAEIPYTPRTTNVFNSTQLRLTCDDNGDLPDGIYEVIISVSPNNKVYKKKIYLRTVFIEYRFNQALLALELSECPNRNNKDLKKKLMEIDLLLSTAKAYADECNEIKAMDFYNLANELLAEFDKKITGCK